MQGPLHRIGDRVERRRFEGVTHPGDHGEPANAAGTCVELCRIRCPDEAIAITVDERDRRGDRPHEIDRG
jgi:hypothetical protein